MIGEVDSLTGLRLAVDPAHGVAAEKPRQQYNGSSGQAAQHRRFPKFFAVWGGHVNFRAGIDGCCHWGFAARRVRECFRDVLPEY